jgi:GDP-4-dehydro-6-deoxy-D-mannose reductase
MKKYLITGFNGFVSRHFVNFLEKNRENILVLGVDVQPCDWDLSNYGNVTVKFVQMDLLDQRSLEACIAPFQPDFILHLASYSSVQFSWANPSLSFTNNMNIFLNLLEVVRKTTPKSRILSIGSSEEYGNVSTDMIPLREESPLNPVSPYAVARVSQELLSKVYCQGFGLDIVMTRSFNHIGPGQKDIFVISSFARQLVEIKKGAKEAKLLTGDISVIRDFLDVRDVVQAYAKLFQHGKTGEVYNVCSSEGHTLREIITMMCDILHVEAELETDPKLLRPSDNQIIIGSNEKLVQSTGWHQDIALRTSLADTIEYWASKLAEVD